METDPDILAIARTAIAEFGKAAARVMQQRADDHTRDGEAADAELWQRVANAIRQLTGH
jgi:hypothetical protein